MKKLKKKLVKKVNKLKNYLEDQLFYAKKSLKLFIKGIQIVISAVLLFVTIVASVLVADRAHKEYLEHRVGDQILFVTSLQNSKIQGRATGFHVKAKSGNVVFVTNAHVCELANDQGLVLILDKLNSKRLVPRRVIEVYSDNDLCVIEPLPGYDGLEVADDLSVGEPVWAIGYPLGESLNISNGRVKDFGSTTLITNIPVDQCEGPKLKKTQIQLWFFVIEVCMVTFDSVQTDIIIYGGNSGSPLLNIWGNVTGVVFAANNRTNWGRAVPLADLNKLLSAY